MSRLVKNLLILAGLSLLILPWFRIYGNFWSFEWLSFNIFQSEEYAPLLFQFLSFERWWLLPVAMPLGVAIAQLLFWYKNEKIASNIQIISGMLGVMMIIIQSFLVGDFGVNYTVLEIIFAE